MTTDRIPLGPETEQDIQNRAHSLAKHIVRKFIDDAQEQLRQHSLERTKDELSEVASFIKDGTAPDSLNPDIAHHDMDNVDYYRGVRDTLKQLSIQISE